MATMPDTEVFVTVVVDTHKDTHVAVALDRPDRKMRRFRGKSDLIDAESAARKVLSGEATAIP